MIALGMIGLVMAYWLTLAAMVCFGILTIVASPAQLLDVIRQMDWKERVTTIAGASCGSIGLVMGSRAGFWRLSL